MPCAELESAVPIMVPPAALHSSGDIMVWLCHRRRYHGFHAASLSSTACLEVAAYNFKENQRFIGVSTWISIDCGCHCENGSHTVLYLRYAVAQTGV